MQTLSGKTILLASGPTFASIDAVRSITNHSSGRLGSEIAYHLHKAGADVIFLAGDTSETPKTLFSDNTLEPMRIHSFRTVTDLKTLLQLHLTQQKIDAVIMAAAVLDYVPETVHPKKHSSQDDEWVIKLKRGEKLIEKIPQWNSTTAIVGFKLESGITETELQQKAVDLINRSGAIFVVGNITETISAHTHHARIYKKNAKDEVTVSAPFTTKPEIAQALTLHLCEYFQHQKETP